MKIDLEEMKKKIEKAGRKAQTRSMYLNLARAKAADDPNFKDSDGYLSNELMRKHFKVGYENLNKQLYGTSGVINRPQFKRDLNVYQASKDAYKKHINEGKKIPITEIEKANAMADGVVLGVDRASLDELILNSGLSQEKFEDFVQKYKETSINHEVMGYIGTIEYKDVADIARAIEKADNPIKRINDRVLSLDDAKKMLITQITKGNTDVDAWKKIAYKPYVLKSSFSEVESMTQKDSYNKPTLH